MKKNKKTLYNYKDLCSFFGEEVKKSNSRTKQFERWRKEYNIEKVEGKNLYTIKELLPSQQLKFLKSPKQVPNNYKLLEPMFMYLLANSEDGKIETTYSDLQEKLGLVNENFKKVKYSKEEKKSLASSLGVTVEELSLFNRETYEINYTNLNSAIKKMEKLSLLYKQDVIMVEYIEDGQVKSNALIGDDYSNFIDTRNKISRQLYSEIYETLDSERKNKVNQLLNVDNVELLPYHSLFLMENIEFYQ